MSGMQPISFEKKTNSKEESLGFEFQATGLTISCVQRETNQTVRGWHLPRFLQQAFFIDYYWLASIQPITFGNNNLKHKSNEIFQIASKKRVKRDNLTFSQILHTVGFRRSRL